jgi:hypothetical protein
MTMNELDALFGEEPEAPKPTLETMIGAMDNNQFGAVVNAVQAEYERRVGPPPLSTLTNAEFQRVVDAALAAAGKPNG